MTSPTEQDKTLRAAVATAVQNFLNMTGTGSFCLNEALPGKLILAGDANKLRLLLGMAVEDAAPAPAAPVLPAGWRAVPEEPTGDMFRAANKIDDQMAAGGSAHGADNEQIWFAMVDAAPALPAAAPVPESQPAALRDALNDLIEVAERCDSWESFPAGALEKARAALSAPAAAPVAASDLHAAIGKIIEQVSALPMLFPDGCKEPGALLRNSEVMAVLLAAGRAALAAVPAAAPVVQPEQVFPTTEEDRFLKHWDSISPMIKSEASHAAAYAAARSAWFEALAPSGTAESKDAALEKRVDQLNAALERAARELPEGYAVRVEVERGAGWVQWFDAEGNEFAIDANDYGLAENVERAINDAFDRAAIASSADEVKP